MLIEWIGRALTPAQSAEQGQPKGIDAGDVLIGGQSDSAEAPYAHLRYGRAPEPPHAIFVERGNDRRRSDNDQGRVGGQRSCAESTHRGPRIDAGWNAKLAALLGVLG